MLFVAAFSGFAFSQTVKITPRKTVYNRRAPVVDFKKSFTVTRPQIIGVTPALAKKIESSVSYEKNLDFNLKEELNDIQWLEEASYEVEYNKNGLLGITLTIEGAGAYPSSSSEPVVVNLQTGAKITPQDVFINLDKLAAQVKKQQADEIKDSIAEIKKEEPEETNPESLFENADFTAGNLKRFMISDKGITFFYEYGFPHAILAFEPGGNFFFSYMELKPFIKPGGLLAKFVR